MNNMNKEQMQKIAGIKSEIVVKPAKGIPSTISITFDTMWLLDKLNDAAWRFSMKLKPIEDINFKSLQAEIQEDFEVQMSQDYFVDGIDAGYFEDFLIDKED